jgi:hypothetical protein
MSVPRLGTVFVGIEDVALRRELLGTLWLHGVDVEEVLGLGVLCTRLVGAPNLGPAPDVVVWDEALGPLAALDEVWRRYGMGASPVLVLVSSSIDEAPESGSMKVCEKDAAVIVETIHDILGREASPRSGTLRRDRGGAWRHDERGSA